MRARPALRVGIVRLYCLQRVKQRGEQQAAARMHEYPSKQDSESQNVQREYPEWIGVGAAHRVNPRETWAHARWPRPATGSGWRRKGVVTVQRPRQNVPAPADLLTVRQQLKYQPERRNYPEAETRLEAVCARTVGRSQESCRLPASRRQWRRASQWRQRQDDGVPRQSAPD